MLISIGILAWNEEKSIENMLSSLFDQSVFTSKLSEFEDYEWEIIVVPNGCSDKTAQISASSLAELSKTAVNSARIKWSVHEVKEAGKSNSWNLYVHAFSSKVADMILMLDADIEFGNLRTIENTVQALLLNTEADVAVDYPLKDATKKRSKSAIEIISVAASSIVGSDIPAIAGSYYCARAAILRNIWIPIGLPVEDGFIRAMILTNCFRSEVNVRKIVRAENASHYYETLTDPFAIFRHEVRIVVGSALNCYLTWDLLRFAIDPNGPGAGVVIKNNLEMNPNWYRELIYNAVSNRGIWVLPKGTLFRRFNRILKPMPNNIIRLKFILISIVEFLFDLPVFIAANRKLKKGLAIGHW